MDEIQEDLEHIEILMVGVNVTDRWLSRLTALQTAGVLNASMNAVYPACVVNLTTPYYIPSELGYNSGVVLSGPCVFV